LAGNIDEVVAFLLSERLLTEFQFSVLKQESDKAKYLCLHLEDLKKTEKLLLLDYEWVILPVERLKLTIVTERINKEFTYS